MNACVNNAARMSVGVAMQAKHNWMTGLIGGVMGGDKTMVERTVMQFEPLEQDRCARTSTRDEGVLHEEVPASRRHRDEAGATAVIVALFFAFIALPLGAASVDVARLYVELERVQAAADAAATAGVTYMPDDLPKAKRARPRDRRGQRLRHDAAAGVTVTVGVGAKPTQLRVTVSSVVENAFARSFGVPTSTMSRSAVADFNGPAPMGSPCNTYGNEPLGGSNRGTSSGSVLSKPALADCSSNPEFWSNIAGPNWPKGNGDQFMTRSCSGAVDGCTGTKNNEFDPRGYFYIVRVQPGAVGKQVKHRAVRPRVRRGRRLLRARSDRSVTDDQWNTYTRTDAKTRYALQSQNNTTRCAPVT